MKNRNSIYKNLQGVSMGIMAASPGFDRMRQG